jgi:electron transfer flavoprotein-quinone oxidoreductase
MTDKFDAIIVGAGFAGSCAAIRLAKAGASVLLVERAEAPGQKNMTGGVLWGRELDDILPNWWKEAPVERFIDHKRLSFLTADSSFSIDFRSDEWGREPHNGFSVLRSRFDSWLAKKAEEAGANLICGVTVRSLAKDKSGKVVGVEGVTKDDVIRADCVVIADGINSRLALQAGLRDAPPRRPVGYAKRKEWEHREAERKEKEGDRFKGVGEVSSHGGGGPKEVPPSMSDWYDMHWCAIGVKEVIRLPVEVMENRFSLQGNSGFANEMVAGFLPGGIKAGVSLYTNKDTLSLSVVINMASLKAAADRKEAIPSFEIIERVKQHRYIRDLIRGGEVVEYAAHLIPEGGWSLISRGAFSAAGVLVAGDAAGLCYSNGMVIQGMNYAAASGKMAADAILSSKKTGDFSASALRAYDDALTSSYVVQDFRKFARVSELTWDDRMHHVYPEVIADVFKDMINERGVPKKSVQDIILSAMKKNDVGLLSAIVHAWRMRGMV